MDRSAHEKHLSQPLQTSNMQFKITVTFLTVYNGIFNVTKKIICLPQDQLMMILLKEPLHQEAMKSRL